MISVFCLIHQFNNNKNYWVVFKIVFKMAIHLVWMSSVYYLKNTLFLIISF